MATKEGDVGVDGTTDDHHHRLSNKKPSWRLLFIMAANLVQGSSNIGQGGSSNFQTFKAQRPPTFKGEVDPIVANHRFQQVDKILESMQITVEATKIQLNTFQLEGKAQQ